MTEVLHSPSTSTYLAELAQLHESNTITDAQFKREEFSLSLVDRGLVTKELYASGAMDAFALNQRSGRDSLTHLLVGDDWGGGHHLPTMMDMETEGRTVASRILDPHNPNSNLDSLRNAQKIRGNGLFRVIQMEITNSETGLVAEKQGNTTMFPNEWSTQDVLEAVLETSKSRGTHDKARRAVDHEKTIKGVLVRAVTDDRTGKIFTAYPKAGAY